MDELDQEFDILASDKDQPVRSTPADKLYELLSKSGCDLAIAALPRGQFSVPAFASLICWRRDRDAPSAIKIRE